MDKVKKCECIDKVKELLKKDGLKIADGCLSLNLSAGDGVVRCGMPLTQIGGKKTTLKQPRVIIAKYCPFCGQEY